MAVRPGFPNDDDVPQLPGCEPSLAGSEPAATDEPDWTPGLGWCRALVRGGAATVVMSLLLAPAAWFAAPVLLNFLLRAFLALVVTWVMFGVVHRAAGMVGARCTALGVILSLLVFLSNHVVFALHGIPTQQGMVGGAAFLTPPALLALNISTAIGVTAGALLRRDGGADLGTLVDVLMRGVWGTTR